MKKKYIEKEIKDREFKLIQCQYCFNFLSFISVQFECKRNKLNVQWIVFISYLVAVYLHKFCINGTAQYWAFKSPIQRRTNFLLIWIKLIVLLPTAWVIYAKIDMHGFLTLYIRTGVTLSSGNLMGFILETLMTVNIFVIKHILLLEVCFRWNNGSAREILQSDAVLCDFLLKHNNH